MLDKIMGRKKVDPDVLFALKWKKPSTIKVFIKYTNGSYFAKVTNLEGNVVTQAESGMDLVEMVNEAVYDYLEIPSQYRAELGYFMPPEEFRNKFNLEIPKQYLNKEIGLVTA